MIKPINTLLILLCSIGTAVATPTIQVVVTKSSGKHGIAVGSSQHMDGYQMPIKLSGIKYRGALKTTTGEEHLLITPTQTRGGFEVDCHVSIHTTQKSLDEPKASAYILSRTVYIKDNEMVVMATPNYTYYIFVLRERHEV